MANILIAWELGGNLGHLGMLRMPAQQALALGHKVYLAAKDISHVRLVLGDLPVVCLQAPFKQNPQLADQSAFLCYSHLLARQCFSSTDELLTLANAWRALFDLIAPELAVFEHAPTALIASRGYAFKRLLLGTAFSIPPTRPSDSNLPSEPLGIFPTTPRTPAVLQALAQDDAKVLAVVNAGLGALGGQKLKPFANLAEIYDQADRQLLFTLPELDHFVTPQQAGASRLHDAVYLGADAPAPRAAPQWPGQGGIKVFAYLSVFPKVEQLLQDLAAAKVCALLVVVNLPAEIKAKYSSNSLRFADHLLDLGQVASQADIAISHASHNCAATFLSAGVPQLVIPQHQEQLFVAMRLLQHGCAVAAYQDQAGYAAEIGALCANPQFKNAAETLKNTLNNRSRLSNELSREKTVKDTIQALIGSYSPNFLIQIE